MSRVVWRDGDFVGADTACLSIDDPGVRWGEGLFETMRGEHGRIPWLDRHLERLERSIATLGLSPMPDLAEVRRGALQSAQRLGHGSARIRVTVTPRPTVLVDAQSVRLDPEQTFTAVTVRGAWHPDRAEAEHKTLSWLTWRRAQRDARARGADVALLLDAEGRLGEGSTVNVFCVIGDEVVTAPATGLLPGVARAVVMELCPVVEGTLAEDVWRAAEEMFATSAVRGVVPITACDGRAVGSGGVGTVTRRLRSAVAGLLSG
jgi:branched-chain amino acid aminotransferase